MDRISFRLVAIALVSLFPLSGIAGTSGGIEGAILVSPSRPGPLRKDDPGPVPVANMEFVVKKGVDRVAKFTTDEQGRFRVSLPPGHYVVLREDPGAAIGHWQFEVDVIAGEVTKVNWTGDSGLR